MEEGRNEGMKICLLTQFQWRNENLFGSTILNMLKGMERKFVCCHTTTSNERNKWKFVWRHNFEWRNEWMKNCLARHNFKSRNAWKFVCRHNFEWTNEGVKIVTKICSVHHNFEWTNEGMENCLAPQFRMHENLFGATISNKGIKICSAYTRTHTHTHTHTGTNSTCLSHSPHSHGLTKSRRNSSLLYYLCACAFILIQKCQT